jgi:ubiquinone/menaquinone biosynthesis C-methylase UbiE
MTDDVAQKSSAAGSFDEHASAYVESRVHRAGDDLKQLATWCRGADAALDVATGAGHTAGAVRDQGVSTVVATDAAPSMVRTAVEEFPGVLGVVADAERLPFASGAFDAVTCRIAAHHFPDPAAFVSEVARVTAPGGTFAFEDNVAPNDDELGAFLNEVERLRDPTHVKSHAVSTWKRWLREAGFELEESLVVSKSIDYRDWVEQLDTPAANRRRLEALFADPPDGAEELYEISRDEDGVESFANLKLLVRATLSP